MRLECKIGGDGGKKKFILLYLYNALIYHVVIRQFSFLENERNNLVPLAALFRFPICVVVPITIAKLSGFLSLINFQISKCFQLSTVSSAASRDISSHAASVVRHIFMLERLKRAHA